MIRTILLFCIGVLCLVPSLVVAQESLILSVTPPFTQMVLVPGDTFRSYVKVVNANAYPLTVYVNPVNFTSSDEQGSPKFIPLLNDPVDATTFAGWINVTREAITIEPESSVNVDYTISVPENAPPGGHFAALLIGTKPPEGSVEAGTVKTSQLVSSLFLARVAGDVREEGQIREFSIARSFVSKPHAEFVLRFENAGNVYVQPQGDITIYNMWGKERGFIPINQKTNFGNVLPNSVRKFSFTWEGESSLTDIGRYTAVATVSYGVDAKRSVDRTVHFWVIPVKGTIITLGFVALFVTFIIVITRLYVRRVLALAGIDQTGAVPRVSQKEIPSQSTTPPVRRLSRREMVAPLREGVLDLRLVVSAPSRGGRSERRIEIKSFVRSYRTSLIALCFGIAGVVLITWYIFDVREPTRPYEVTLTQEGRTVTLSSDTVETGRRDALVVDPGIDTTHRTRVTIVNASGVPGAVQPIAQRLENEGFAIGDVSTNEDTRSTSVVVTNAHELKDAERISELWEGIPLSVRPPGEEAEPALLFIIGSDHVQ